jgi:hypothetical protein
MSDKHDDLTRRAAELAECVLRARSTAAELVAETEQLAYRFAEVRKTRTRALEQIRERPAHGTAADTGQGDLPGSDPSPETAAPKGCGGSWTGNWPKSAGSATPKTGRLSGRCCRGFALTGTPPGAVGGPMARTEWPAAGIAAPPRSTVRRPPPTGTPPAATGTRPSSRVKRKILQEPLHPARTRRGESERERHSWLWLIAR